MPSRSPNSGATVKRSLLKLGEQIRTRRKRLGVSAVAAAESAGMSRVTLHRIERGEPSVTMAAYLSAILALGDTLELREVGKTRERRRKKLPRKIRIVNYPELKRIAWQLKKTKEITPQEALELYERNWKYIEPNDLEAEERDFIEELLAAFGRERLLV